jgi:NAD-dependent deacetylase
MRITILTGAGISQESGLKTFRDQNGLWENHDITEVANFDSYQRDPELVHRFYNLRREQLKEVEPNAAHFALAKLEDHFDTMIITQNVDDLHERAGSKNILHMHGELRKIRDINSHEITEFHDSVKKEDFSKVRPHIVWFGEMIMHADEIQDRLVKTDLFLSIGTSSQVYPAAQFFQFVKQIGGKCVELNYEETQMTAMYDEGHLGKATEVVPKFVEKLIGG